MNGTGFRVLVMLLAMALTETSIASAQVGGQAPKDLPAPELTLPGDVIIHLTEEEDGGLILRSGLGDIYTYVPAAGQPVLVTRPEPIAGLGDHWWGAPGYYKARVVASKEKIWASSQKGLIEIDRKTKATRLYDTQDALPSPKIRDMVFDGSRIWMTTDGGSGYFDTKSGRFVGGINLHNAYEPASPADGQVWSIIWRNEPMRSARSRPSGATKGERDEAC